MPSEASIHYDAQLAKALAARAKGDEVAEDAIADELDSVWWEMTDQERLERWVSPTFWRDFPPTNLVIASTDPREIHGVVTIKIPASVEPGSGFTQATWARKVKFRDGILTTVVIEREPDDPLRDSEPFAPFGIITIELFESFWQQARKGTP